jgi:hypothetical protein
MGEPVVSPGSYSRRSVVHLHRSLSVRAEWSPTGRMPTRFQTHRIDAVSSEGGARNGSIASLLDRRSGRSRPSPRAMTIREGFPFTVVVSALLTEKRRNCSVFSALGTLDTSRCRSVLTVREHWKWWGVADAPSSAFSLEMWCVSMCWESQREQASSAASKASLTTSGLGSLRDGSFTA